MFPRKLKGTYLKLSCATRAISSISENTSDIYVKFTQPMRLLTQIHCFHSYFRRESVDFSVFLLQFNTDCPSFLSKTL